MNVAAVILAAGASRRLGRPKQTVRLPNGATLVEHAVAVATRAACSPILLVVGDKWIRSAGVMGARLVQNKRWREGMGRSLAAGVAEAPADAAILVTTCDQPHVAAGDLCRLLKAVAAPDDVAAAEYDGRVGVPACFGPGHRPALLAAAGDRGMRDLLRSAKNVHRMPMPAAAFDVDTEQEVVQLAEMTARTIKLFGPQAKLAGTRELRVTVAKPVTVAAVLHAIATDCPPLAASAQASRLAVNQRFAGSDEAVAAGDELALIGMISGG